MRLVTTAGEVVAVECAAPGMTTLLESATAGALRDTSPAAALGEPGVADVLRDPGATVHLVIQRQRRPFDHRGWRSVARGVWAAPPQVLLTDACSSGFDLLVQPLGRTLRVTARYRPTPRIRAANIALPGRFRLLAAQTVLHYPVLWWASLRGRVPLHVSVTAGAGGVTMLAGPGGVGKSTLLAAGMPGGEVATADNVCACDANTAYGLVEPLRVDSRGHGGGGGPHAPHGRTEYPIPGRVPQLTPERLVVLRRGPADRPVEAVPVAPQEAARDLVTGTYMAGELRRFWQFAATLALATGLGPAHPDVAGVATAIASRLPCLELRLGRPASAPLSELLTLVGTA
jgi:hypothetical protein